jgi:DNA-directed RNA polymerase II subunit RPB2
MSQPPFNWDSQTWNTLDSYFAQNKILTQHQIESYNDFIDYIIPQTIERNNPVIIATDYFERIGPNGEKIGDFHSKYTIEFLQTYLSKPLIKENNDIIKPLTPNEARLRNLTYVAPMFVDVRHTLVLKDDEGREIKSNDQMTAIETKIPFSKLPVMLHSKYCHLSDLSDTGLAEMGECEYDQGGYFIVNGGEKVLVSQERVAENQVFCWPPSKSSTGKYSHEVEIKSSIDQRFYPVKTNKVCLTREPSLKAVKESMNGKQGVSGRTFKVKMPYLREEIPLFIMFRALGIVTEREIYEMILSNTDAIGSSNYTNMLLASAEEARSYGAITQDSALQYISHRLNLTFQQKDKDKDALQPDPDIKLKYIRDILNRELLPHVGQDNRKKAFFLGHMTRKLIDCYFGVRPYDDRDHYGSKRLDLAGALLTKLFQANFIKLVKDLRKEILPKLPGLKGVYNALRKLIQSCNIESKIKYGLSTGNWSTQKTAISSSKKGIAQVLNRLSFIGSLSHTRRVMSPLERAGSKIVAPRRLHSTHFGMCCPNETPEGGQIGIVKNLAMQTHITIQTSDYPIRIALTALGVKDLSETLPNEIWQSTKVFVNGDWVGVVPDKHAKRLHDQLKLLKRHGIIVPYISCTWYIDWREIQIKTDGGRYSRPLYIVEDEKLLIEDMYNDPNNSEFRQKFTNGEMKWMDFLSGFNTNENLDNITVSNGALVEYLDTDELEMAMVAMTYADLAANNQENNYYMHYSHCEIHPIMFMGIVSTMIPSSDHNQSPRNCYQSSMGKQAIGFYVTNYNSRMDTMAHVLVYGHKPLVATRTMKYVMMDRLPHGEQAMLLYACYTGYNQEDSIILNDDAIKRGFFNTIFYRTYTDKEQKHKSQTIATERFCKPTKATTREYKHGSYDLINDDGVPRIGGVAKGGDVIIGKVVESKEIDPSGLPQKDVSTTVHKNEHGTVDMTIPDAKKSIHNYNAEGHKFIKVRVSILRQPEIGDKFASRHSQKGTDSMNFPMEDLPFNSYGLCPDIIMNPHGIPSRMTAGKLIETLLGKVAVCHGQFQDATPFTPFNLKKFEDILELYGCHKLGNEVMYNGQMGNMFEVTFFYGPTYYQRLKHMVDDKIHSRETGPVQLLTRQPAEGRSRDGGLRLGEMERDCEAQGTKIALASGVSVAIETLVDCNSYVLGWSEKLNGIVKAKQSNFMDKGVRECVEITLEDGRKIRCTENHPILRTDNQWIKAGDLKVGEDCVKVGIDPPLVNFIDDMKECNGWKLDVGSYHFKTGTHDEYMKTLAFARLCGYIITDGCVSKSGICVFLGHELDVDTITDDLQLICPEYKHENYKKLKNAYIVTIPKSLANGVKLLPGIITCRRVNQDGDLPHFIIDKNCPKSIVREFLGGLFGGDGHTPYLGMRRGECDINASVAFSQTKSKINQASLKIMIENVRKLLVRMGINKTTTRAPKKITASKNKEFAYNKKLPKIPLKLKAIGDIKIPLFTDLMKPKIRITKDDLRVANIDTEILTFYENEIDAKYNSKSEEIVVPHYEIMLYLSIEELINFSERVGFRYCSHKAQRLAAAVTYKRLRTEVIRQHNWMYQRSMEIYKQVKSITRESSILLARQELADIEPILHEYGVPTRKHVENHSVGGTKFSKFNHKKFPIIEKFMKNIGAIDSFSKVAYEGMKHEVQYGVSRENRCLPTFNLKVMHRKSIGPQPVYDITVDDVHSFLANGVVSHNCFIGHGSAKFYKEKTMNSSDLFKVYISKKEETMIVGNPEKRIFKYDGKNLKNDEFSEVQLPYAMKLLIQEVESMGIDVRLQVT